MADRGDALVVKCTAMQKEHWVDKKPQFNIHDDAMFNGIPKKNYAEIIMSYLLPKLETFFGKISSSLL